MKKSRFIPFISTSPIEDIWLAVLLIPLWWVLGFRFFIFHLIVIIAFFKMRSLRKRESKSWMPFEIYTL
ncbi:MAG: hypothetical protein KAX11_09260, partial [Candidatus Aminicenantes bacterium]|nr:hypothetical protein [Candidatus Aminicenantes bacterium]